MLQKQQSEAAVVQKLIDPIAHPPSPPPPPLESTTLFLPSSFLYTLYLRCIRFLTLMIWSLPGRPGAPCSLYSIFFFFCSLPHHFHLILVCSFYLLTYLFLAILPVQKVFQLLSLCSRKAFVLFVFFPSLFLSINSGRSPH